MSRRARARSLLLALLVTASVAGAGCFGAPSETKGAVPRDPDGAPDDLDNLTFTPPFALRGPEIRVTLEDGRPARLAEAGANLTLVAVFPAASGVDASKVASYVWDFGDGASSVGPEQRHRYDAPGVYALKVTVEDVYGRVATSSRAVGVAENRTESGVVAVGNGARDQAAYASGAQAWDHRDFPLDVAPGASSARFTLKFDKRPSVSGALIPAEANNLVLKLLDDSGRPIGTAAGAANPKMLDLDGRDLPPGSYVLRVSGDSGLQVGFSLSILVLYGGLAE